MGVHLWPVRGLPRHPQAALEGGILSSGLMFSTEQARPHARSPGDDGRQPGAGPRRAASGPVLPPCRLAVRATLAVRTRDRCSGEAGELEKKLGEIEIFLLPKCRKGYLMHFIKCKKHFSCHVLRSGLVHVWFISSSSASHAAARAGHFESDGSARAVTGALQGPAARALPETYRPSPPTGPAARSEAS